MESSQLSTTHTVDFAATSPPLNSTDLGNTRSHELPSFEMLDRQVRHLLDKLTTEVFDSTSDQIIKWINEGDGKTLGRVVQLVFERAVDDTTSSEIYARLCYKMVDGVNKEIQDHEVQDVEGESILGGQLGKVLLHSCREFSERIWMQKEVTAVTLKSMEEEAFQISKKDKAGVVRKTALYLEEYHAAEKAKQQNLALIRFISELFRLQMLTEKIMHEHLRKLLGNLNPEEEDIEGLCTMLTEVGSILDTQKTRARMDVYFQRVKELAKNPNVSPRMQLMLKDIIELRENKWMVAGDVAAPPMVIHKEPSQKEKKSKAKESDKEGRGKEKGKLRKREEEEHEGRCREGKGKAAESKNKVKNEQTEGEGGSIVAPENSDAVPPSGDSQGGMSLNASAKRILKKHPPPLNLSLSLSQPRSLPIPHPFPASTIPVIDDLQRVSYPDGISGPKPELNVNARNGRFRYDRDFLMQFMGVCQSKPDTLPPLGDIGLGSIEPGFLGLTVVRGGSSRRKGLK